MYVDSAAAECHGAAADQMKSNSTRKLVVAEKCLILSVVLGMFGLRYAEEKEARQWLVLWFAFIVHME